MRRLFSDRLSRPVDDIWTVRVLVLPAGESGTDPYRMGMSRFQFATLFALGILMTPCEVHIIPFQEKSSLGPMRAPINAE